MSSLLSCRPPPQEALAAVQDALAQEASRLAQMHYERGLLMR